MNSLFHQHQFDQRLLTGLTLAKSYRTCACGIRQTLMEDAETKEQVWIDGCFTQDDTDVLFVFAATEPSFSHEVSSLRDLMQDSGRQITFIWVHDDRGLGQMQFVKNPMFWLAEDWTELDIINSQKFRLLMCTRRLS